MHFNKCCTERRFPQDISFDDGEYFCKRCGSYLARGIEWNWSDYRDHGFRKYASKPYDPKHHAGHVLNCLESLEMNKPCREVIDKLKLGGISKRALYANSSVALRKHLPYVWGKLNGIEPLRIKPEHRAFLIGEISKAPVLGVNRGAYHGIIAEVIQAHPEMSYILPYLSPH